MKGKKFGSYCLYYKIAGKGRNTEPMWKGTIHLHEEYFPSKRKEPAQTKKRDVSVLARTVIEPSTHVTNELTAGRPVDDMGRRRRRRWVGT